MHAYVCLYGCMCILCGNATQVSHSLRSSIYIYIYIYMFVRMHKQSGGHRPTVMKSAAEHPRGLDTRIEPPEPHSPHGPPEEPDPAPAVADRHDSRVAE